VSLPNLQIRPTWMYVIEGADEWGPPLYVGVTADLPSRMRQHRLSKAWWGEGRLIVASLYATREEALRLEAAWINHLRPLYNVDVPRDRLWPADWHPNYDMLEESQLVPGVDC
jgi:predicted GIY-YIG superfamily endonuclease